MNMETYASQNSKKILRYISKAELLVNLGLKFNMTKSEKTLDSIIQSINELNCIEKTLISSVIRAIDNKYNLQKIANGFQHGVHSLPN